MPNPWGTAISLAAARTIVVRALAHARSSDFPPMTVAVLDAAGRLVTPRTLDTSDVRLWQSIKTPKVVTSCVTTDFADKT
jgi:uncharacterized protein GlcG (DUF336 family)